MIFQPLPGHAPSLATDTGPAPVGHRALLLLDFILSTQQPPEDKFPTLDLLPPPAHAHQCMTGEACGAGRSGGGARLGVDPAVGLP